MNNSEVTQLSYLMAWLAKSYDSKYHLTDFTNNCSEKVHHLVIYLQQILNRYDRKLTKNDLYIVANTLLKESFPDRRTVGQLLLNALNA